MNTTEVPDSYVCNISRQVMMHPVMDPTDGNSYERDSITEWVRRTGTSPMTRRPLREDQLVYNRNLKELIERFRQDHPLVVEAYNNAAASASAPASASEAGETRKPLILFLIIDNSASMATDACNPDTSKRSGAAPENDRYSRMDLAKHTMYTIITSMGSQDKVCVINFHSYASVFIPMESTTPRAKEKILDRLETLQPLANTYMFSGLCLAVDEMAKHVSKEEQQSHNVQFYMLTDGEDNVDPPEPLDVAISKYMQKKLVVRPVINTFAYGYQLDSRMLYVLSKLGCRSGAFGFIPDASMVGTVFINAMCNTLLEENTTSLCAVEVCNISDRFVTLVGDVLLSENLTGDQKLVELDKFVQSLSDSDDATVQEFLVDLKVDCVPSRDPNVGQIAKAIDKRYYREWGKHYLRSVKSAFETRTCINFKDKAMQRFRTPKFQEEQERITEIFYHVKQPMPSIKATPRANSIGAASASTSRRRQAAAAALSAAGFVSVPAAGAASTNITQYYDPSGGCFTAKSRVFVQIGGKSVPTEFSALRRGTKVMTANGVSEIEAVVKMKYSGTIHSIADGLHLTPYHPLMIDGKSYFPCNLSFEEQVTEHTDIYVYDIVLKNRSLVEMASYPSSKIYAATLGHTKNDDHVFKHDYFASEEVVNDLKMRRTYFSTGEIVSDRPTFVRDELSQQVKKIIF